MKMRRPDASMMGGTGLGDPSAAGLESSPMGAAPGVRPPGAAAPPMAMPPPGPPPPMGGAPAAAPGQAPGPHLEAPMNPGAFQRAFLIRELLGGQADMADPNAPNAGLPPGFSAPKPYPPPGPPARRR